MLNKQTSGSATVENPTTISAALTAAAEQTLGIAPTADQINKFVAAIQGQDVSYAEAGNEENKAQAQSDLARAQSAESALNKLGPDGIDSFPVGLPVSDQWWRASWRRYSAGSGDWIAVK